MPLVKKLFRTMLEKKAQYLSAWLLVVISSMLFYSCIVAGANLIDNLNHFYQTHHVEDAQFVLQKPLSNVKDFEKKYHVSLEGRQSKDISINNQAVLRVLNATQKIDQYSVIKGTKLKSDHDILIDPGFAKAHHLSIGDKLKLNGQTFDIKGTMSVPDYIYPLKSVSGFLKNPNAFGVAVVKGNVLNHWSGVNHYYSVQMGQSNKSEIKKALNQSNRVLQWIDKKDNNRISFIKGDIQGIKKMGETLPFGILFITIIIVLIVLWRLLKNEYVQIGTLYALGYTKQEIMRHYLSYSIFLAILGSVIGTIFGWGLLHPLLSMYAAFYNLPVLMVKPHLVYLLISLLLPLIFFVPLTYLLVWRVLKIPPVLLMKGGELRLKVNVFERAFRLKHFKFSTRFKIREMLRGIPRVIFFIIGIVFSTLLLLLGFVTKDSMTYLVQDNFKHVYHYQYDYVYNQLQMTPPASGDVASAAPFKLVSKDKQSLIIYGLKPNNHSIQLKDMKGNKLTFQSVIINKSLADKLGVVPGDSIKVENQLNNKTFSLTINHIANSYLGDVIYMPLNEFNRLNGLPKGSYTELYTNKKLAIDPKLLMSTTETKSTIDGYQQMIKPLSYGVSGIAIASGAIAVIIIYILISLLIEENVFKISLMKVMGYDERSLRKLIINYNIWFVLLGFIVGIPVTLFSMSSFLDSITADMSLSIPVKVHWVNVLIGFIILLVAYYISLFLNRKKIKHISMHEAINKSTE